MRRSLRSRSLKAVKKKVQGNRVALHYTRRNPNIAKCGQCGRPLSGVPRLRQAEFNKLTKTGKRPERPYGGTLCPECTRRVFRMKVVGIGIKKA